MSLSSRRAWIEILSISSLSIVKLCRSPHGERGLKYLYAYLYKRLLQSLSSRRAWIEIKGSIGNYESGVSLSSRRAWIEIIYAPAYTSPTFSRSPHGERGLKYRCMIKA